MINEIVNEEVIYGEYYQKINDMILKSRENIRRNFNLEMVELYYEIGATINELIEKYHLDASQNEIIKLFSEKLTKKN